MGIVATFFGGPRKENDKAAAGTKGGNDKNMFIDSESSESLESRLSLGAVDGTKCTGLLSF
jgi:hypothetical protein